MTAPTGGSGGTRARREARAASSEGRATVATVEPTVQEPKPAAAAAAAGVGGRVPPRRRSALDPDKVVALEEERDFLLTSLEDLDREHDAGDVDDVDYAELRDDYTARAAAAIRALDDHAAVMDASNRGRSWMRIAAILVVVGLIGGGAGWLVASSSGERDPGGSLSGDIRSSSLGEIQKGKGFTGQARQALNDGDTDRAVQLYQQAIAAYRSALDIDPNNAEALTYQGWLLHNLFLLFDGSGAADQAQQFEQGAVDSIDQALEINPTYSDALVFRAVIALRQGRPADALADLNALPPGGLPTEMQGLVEQKRQEAQDAVDGVTATTADAPVPTTSPSTSGSASGSN